MRIVVVGTGYVGLVSGVCFAEFGFHVTCVDKDAHKISLLAEGKSPIYEPGLEHLLEENISAKRLSFTTDLAAAVQEASIIFIAVGTPTRYADGYADLSYVFAAAEEIAHSSSGYKLIVTKSTVPAGTGDKIRKIITETNSALAFDIASNPEFLREGSAIEDFMHPDRVIIGVDSQRARDMMAMLYRPLKLSDTALFFTSIISAELIKYASNSFLAVKIGFINEIADLCEKLGGNVLDVAHGMGLDDRIGKKFLQPGPGYGGSCFPKDTIALIKMAEFAGVRSRIVEAAVMSNDLRRYRMAEVIDQACDGVKGKTIAMLGLTFKPGTDDMRESPSLFIIPELIRAGAHIRVYDPQGMQEAKKLLTQPMEWCKDAYNCMQSADALVLLTEWNEFLMLDLDKVRSLLNKPLVVDLRNIYKRDEMAASGLRYVSIGRPAA